MTVENGRTPAITGIGLITGLGVGVERSWSRLLAGDSCLRPVERDAQAGAPSRQIGGLLPDEFENECARRLRAPLLHRTADFTRLGLLAASLATEDAGITSASVTPERAAVIVGNSVGALRYLEDLFVKESIKSSRSIAEILSFESLAVIKFMQNALSAQISLSLGYRGPSMVVSTACSSGNSALAIACDMIRAGKCDLALAGGVEAGVSDVFLTSFGNLGALSSYPGDPAEAVRPFDKDRSGTALADGAALFVVESLEHAARRRREPYCHVLGSSVTCESFHIVKPEPSGKGMARTIQAALDDAGVRADDIDHIQAHGTGTRDNDLAETKAIKEVFGERARRIPIHSTKGATGHTIGAAGPVSVAVGCLAMKTRQIPPTRNHLVPGAGCDLFYCPTRLDGERIEKCLCSAFAFGGHNACLVLGRT